jgi:hypothetical protein
MIRIHNLSTNEVIDREMNDAEFTRYEADQVKVVEEAIAAASKASEKGALLARLGITVDEAKLLLG